MSPCPFSFFARALCLHLGGDKRVRTADPLLAKQVLSQLSYTPVYSLSSSLLLSASFFNGSHSRRFPVTPRSPPLLRKKFLDNRKVPQNFVLLPTLLLSTSFFRASALGASFEVLVGSSGLEPPTSRLSGVRSNHLSYEPMSVFLFRSRPLPSSWWR